MLIYSPTRKGWCFIMANLQEDLRTLDLIFKDEYETEFNKIFPRSNECLMELFNRVDVKDNNVYSVLSASDYLFSLYNNGASNVDTFDIQPLTLRYYYLRKWILATGFLDADDLDLYAIKGLVINMYEKRQFLSKDEEESIIFWLSYLDRISSYRIYKSELFYDMCGKYDKVPYKNNYKCLANSLNSKLLKFDNIDICESNTIDLYKFHCYDKIFLSNIIDYNGSREKLTNLLTNVRSLLKENGEIICSCLFRTERGESKLQEEIFSQYYDYEELYINRNNRDGEIYYKYVRKK
jgi:hypothetical protein